ncbi:hypothetical protein BH10PSE13_BH10PSE13_11290 [soil metagenome]
MPYTRLLNATLVRFGIVAVGGLCIDLLVSWTLAAIVGLPLPVAALCGFLVAAASNYVVHEGWTFGGGGKLTAQRGMLYLCLMAATLGVRLIAVTALQAWVFTRPGHTLAPLLLATGFSFLFNFGLSKYLVFRRPDTAWKAPLP